MSIYLGENMVYRGHETIRQADANNVGGIKANAKTSEEDLEVRIDTNSGLLYTKSFVPSNLTVLETTSGTISLEDNNFYRLTPTGAVTFTLPSVSADGKLHQILVQIKLTSAYTLNLGTAKYFSGEAPDLSKAGSYNLIWEHDADLGWVCGCLVKG